jgi:DNA-directed RNA polymerase specialized sigma24 family protein
VRSSEDIPSHTTVREKDRKLTAQAFNRLLVWLDEGSDSQGQKYLEMRARLVVYFDRKNCSTPDDLADETLNRIARRLDEEGISVSDTPARYCYIVARFVFLEYLRGKQKTHTLFTDLGKRCQEPASIGTDGAGEQRQRLLSCLERCLEGLDVSQREIIARYYTGEQRQKINNRRALADDLGISPNALSIRACRIRDKLEACVRECLGQD